ncbi:MAG: glycosyltransferase family 39 protein, partial [Planctomycetota bacterium]
MSRKHRERKRQRRLRQEQAEEPAREAATPWAEALRARAVAIARNRYAAPAALAVLTLAIYARSIDDPLIYWDDNLYILDDARIQELSLANARKIMTESFAANYHPLTTFTFALDRALWGGGLPDETWGFHLTQLVFYAGGVVLLYFVFRHVLGSAPAAFAGAAIYAMHTIHVESVAWLASRKDVVCLFFYAAAMLAYFRYAKEEKMRWGRYALFVALAAAAMFSKGYAAPLPFVLLAYDWVIARKVDWRRIVDKIPLVALAVALFLVMAAAQDKDATPLGEIDTYGRLLQQCKIYAVYVARTILPVRLSINYCYVVRIDWLSGWVAGLGALLGAGTVAAFFVLRRRLPAAAFGIAVLVMQLGTVMSVFITLRQWMTDRYLFFPTIGSTLALAAGGLWLHGWLHRSKSVPEGVRRYAVPAAAVATVALYS